MRLSQAGPYSAESTRRPLSALIQSQRLDRCVASASLPKMLRLSFVPQVRSLCCALWPGGIVNQPHSPSWGPAHSAGKDNPEFAIPQVRPGCCEVRPVWAAQGLWRGDIEAVDGISTATNVILRHLRGRGSQRLLVQHTIPEPEFQRDVDASEPKQGKNTIACALCLYCDLQRTSKSEHKQCGTVMSHRLLLSVRYAG